MTVETIQQREQLATVIEEYLENRQGEAFYPVDLIETFQNDEHKEAIILSAIWRLIDQHRIQLNNVLQVTAFSSPN